MKYRKATHAALRRSIPGIVLALGLLSCSDQTVLSGVCDVSYVRVETPAKLVLLTGCRQDLQTLSRADLRRIEDVVGDLAQKDERRINIALRNSQVRESSVCIKSRSGGMEVVPRNSLTYCVEVRSEQASAVLIGLRGNIDTFSQVELGKMSRALDSIIQEERLGIIGKLHLPTFRSAVAARLNRLLKRRVVGDIYWETASISEPVP
jgi:hypothetical protein